MDALANAENSSIVIAKLSKPCLRFSASWRLPHRRNGNFTNTNITSSTTFSGHFAPTTKMAKSLYQRINLHPLHWTAAHTRAFNILINTTAFPEQNTAFQLLLQCLDGSIPPDKAGITKDAEFLHEAWQECFDFEKSRAEGDESHWASQVGFTVVEAVICAMPDHISTIYFVRGFRANRD